jgi:hypothetical protein
LLKHTLMKKYLLLLLVSASLFIVGCDTTKEISLNNDSSGTYVTTTDLSSLMGLAKMSGQNKEMEKVKDQVMDTVIMMDKLADSIPSLTAEDKALVRKGKLFVNMNMPEEKFIMKMEFPFANTDQLGRLDKLTSRLVSETLSKEMGKGELSQGMGGSEEDSMPKSSMEDYFNTTYSKNIIEKKLNKEKYAMVGDDKTMQTMKQMSGMGSGTSTLIINLPRAVKKAEGKNVKLSEDKKKITISSSMDDFFDDASSMEFRIEF